MEDICGELGVTFWLISPGHVAGGGKKNEKEGNIWEDLCSREP